MENTDFTLDLYNILFVSYFIIIIIGIVKGAGENRSIIIFEDYDDLGLTFLIPSSFVLIIYLFAMFGANQMLGIILASIISSGLFIKLVINTYNSNLNNVFNTSLSILTKMPISIIWILNFIEVLNPSGKGSQRAKNRGAALVILALLTPILSLLIVDKSGSFFNPRSWIKGRRVGSSIRNSL